MARNLKFNIASALGPFQGSDAHGHEQPSRFLRLPTEIQGLIFDEVFRDSEPRRIRLRKQGLPDFFDARDVTLRELFLLNRHSGKREFWPSHPYFAVSQQCRAVALRSYFRKRTFAFRAREDDVVLLRAVTKEWRNLLTSVCLTLDLKRREMHSGITMYVQEILALLPNLRYLRLDIRDLLSGWSLGTSVEDIVQRTPFRYPFTDIPWVHAIAEHPRLQFFSTIYHNRYDDWSDWRTSDHRPFWWPDSYGIHRMDWYIRICIAAKRHSPDKTKPTKGISYWQDEPTGWVRFSEDCGQFQNVQLSTQRDIVKFFRRLFLAEGNGEGARWCATKAKQLHTLRQEEKMRRHVEMVRAQRRIKQMIVAHNEMVAAMAYDTELSKYDDEVYRLETERAEKAAKEDLLYGSWKVNDGHVVWVTRSGREASYLGIRRARRLRRVWSDSWIKVSRTKAPLEIKSSLSGSYRIGSDAFVFDSIEGSLR